MKRADHDRRGKPLCAGEWLQGVLGQMVRQARADVAAIRDDPKTAIHRLRKRMKKLRSLVQLAAPVLPDAAHDALRGQIRRIKDAVAARRDADVLTALAHDLGTAPAGGRPARPQARKLAPLVKALAGSVQRLPLAPLTWEEISHQYVKTAKRARRAWKEARDHPSEEALHDWRKLVKRHYHQSLALHRWLGRRADGRLLRIRKLGSLLGRCHDLDVFASSVESRRASRARRNILRKVGHRREKLTKRTFRRAEKLFDRAWPDLKTPTERQPAFPKGRKPRG